MEIIGLSLDCEIRTSCAKIVGLVDLEN